MGMGKGYTDLDDPLIKPADDLLILVLFSWT